MNQKMFAKNANQIFPESRLVDKAGNVTKEKEFGLLLLNGGTVCNNDFGTNAANAACHLMG